MKKPELVPVEVNAMILEAQGECAALLDTVKRMPDIATVPLNEIFVAALAHAKRINDAREKITKPQLAAKKAVDDYFMPWVKGYQAIADECRLKIERAALASIQAEDEARAQARAALQAGDQKAAAALVAAQAPIEQAANLAVVIEWGYEFDGHELPREYMTPDHAKIKAYLAGYKGATSVPPVPGLRFVRAAASRKKG